MDLDENPWRLVLKEPMGGDQGVKHAEELLIETCKEDTMVEGGDNGELAKHI